MWCLARSLEIAPCSGKFGKSTPSLTHNSSTPIGLPIRGVVNSAFSIKFFSVGVIFVAEADVDRLCLIVVTKLHHLTSPQPLLDVRLVLLKVFRDAPERRLDSHVLVEDAGPLLPLVIQHSL